MSKTPERTPLFLMRSSAGKINHLFPIETSSVDKVLKCLKITPTTTTTNNTTNKKYSKGEIASLFGSISSDGCLQIWDLQKRRPILTLNTHLPTTSWADFYFHPSENKDHNDQHCIEFKFLLYSRKSGLYYQKGDKIDKNSLVRLPLEDVHCGFCKPLLIPSSSPSTSLSSPSSQILICPCGSDSIVKITQQQHDHDHHHVIHDLNIKPNIEQISINAPVTFLQNISHKNWILIGTEDGKINLIDISTSSSSSSTTSSPTLLESINLNEESSTTTATTTNNKLCKDENFVPLCCDGNENNGYYLIGTSSEELILIKINGTNNETAGGEFDENPPLQPSLLLNIDKIIKVHRRGTSCIKLRPDGNIIVVAGWDTRIRLFNFPQIKQLTALDCHSLTISSLLFIPIPIHVHHHGLKSGTTSGSNELEKDEEKEGSSSNNIHGKKDTTTTTTDCHTHSSSVVGVSDSGTTGSNGYYLLSSSHDSSLAVWDHFVL